MERPASARAQALPYCLVALAATAMAAALVLLGSTAFRRFFGQANPVLVLALAGAAGAALLWYLVSRSPLLVAREGGHGGLYASSVLALALALGIVLVDRAILFPRDMNILFPESLLFYPAIGFVVEVLFHLLPLALLYALLRSALGLPEAPSLLASVLAVSLVEPAFQALDMAGKGPPWAVGYVACHVLAVNLVQLFLFRRYDFLSMYAFRLFYYALWHVLWGSLRLRLLF